MLTNIYNAPQLQEERQKRMLASDDTSDEESDAPEDVKASTMRLRSISGDDLGDSFALDEEQGTKRGWVDEILERQDAEDLESEDGEASEDSESAEDDGDEEGPVKDNVGCENTLSLKDWEQSDDDNLSTDLEEEEGEEEGEEEHDDDDDDEMEPKGHKKAKSGDAIEIKKQNRDSLGAKKVKANSKQPSIRKDSVPFLIEAPNSLEEFLTLLENCSNDDIVAAINRIRVCNAISLKAENRKKIQVWHF